MRRIAEEAAKQVGVGLLVLGFVGLFACGGRAIDDPGSGSGENEPAPTSTAHGSAGKSGTSSASPPLPATPLGKCVPGFNRDQNPTRPCPWVSEAGACFETSAAACNCICPTNRDSLCVHDFESSSGFPELVLCD